MGRVQGKVALITGAARGQGREHAVHLAAEGADIVAVDICQDIETNRYSLATVDDLAQTASLVEKQGRKVITCQADVRDAGAMKEAAQRAATEFGHLDIVVANAGICPMGGDLPVQAFADVVNVNLVGTMNTIHAALPHLQAGASIIATGSLAAFMPNTIDNPAGGPGGRGYTFAKRAIAHYVHDLAKTLAPSRIRVNAVHPTNCDTDMLHSQPMYRQFRPDLEKPERSDVEPLFMMLTAMQVPYVESSDVSGAVVFLASDEARYVTGMQMRVDAGGYLNVHEFHI